MTGPLEHGVSVTIAEARASTIARRRRDEELARWAGLGPDEVAPFLRRLEEFDARTPAWTAREAAAAAAHHVQRRAELLEMAGLLDERLQPVLDAVDRRLAQLADDLGATP